MDPSSSNKTMEKPNPDPHPQQQPLKCPRCDSSNTKFCYYNNYSLSQPRHFCKACKRYWTRGGTLRSVPVGGGCRKNKRVKRPPPPQLASSAATSHVHATHDIDLSPASNHMSTSLFYNNSFHHPTNNPLELNFPFSRFASSRVSSGFEFYQPNLNDFGLGFSNTGVLSTEIQEDPVNLFGFGSSSGSSSTMASLLASIQQQQKFGLKETPANGTGFSGLMPYEHLDLQGRDGNGISNRREEKVERDDRLDQYHQNNQIHHDQQQINISSDANNSSLIWNTSNITSWFDPYTNSMGSSVPSLI